MVLRPFIQVVVAAALLSACRAFTATARQAPPAVEGHPPEFFTLLMESLPEDPGRERRFDPRPLSTTVDAPSLFFHVSEDARKYILADTMEVPDGRRDAAVREGLRIGSILDHAGCPGRVPPTPDIERLIAERCPGRVVESFIASAVEERWPDNPAEIPPGAIRSWAAYVISHTAYTRTGSVMVYEFVVFRMPDGSTQSKLIGLVSVH